MEHKDKMDGRNLHYRLPSRESIIQLMDYDTLDRMATTIYQQLKKTFKKRNFYKYQNAIYSEMTWHVLIPRLLAEYFATNKDVSTDMATSLIISAASGSS